MTPHLLAEPSGAVPYTDSTLTCYLAAWAVAATGPFDFVALDSTLLIAAARHHLLSAKLHRQEGTAADCWPCKELQPGCGVITSLGSGARKSKIFVGLVSVGQASVSARACVCVLVRYYAITHSA